MIGIVAAVAAMSVFWLGYLIGWQDAKRDQELSDLFTREIRKIELSIAENFKPPTEEEGNKT
jgi:hypothetical protein